MKTKAAKPVRQKRKIFLLPLDRARCIALTFGKYSKYEMDEEGNVKKDAADQPILHPKFEQDWCFAYGESDWMGRQIFYCSTGKC